MTESYPRATKLACSFYEQAEEAKGRYPTPATRSSLLISPKNSIVFFMTIENPQLYMDCDDTAVPGHDPRSLHRRLLSGRSVVSIDFLHGVLAARGNDNKPNSQVEIAGILTMRPPIFKRLTRYEIGYYGLKGLIPRDDQLRHVGSDSAKASFLVTASQYRDIGMLDDGSHRLVSPILRAFALLDTADSTVEPSILLGAINHSGKRGDSRMIQTLGLARNNFGNSAVAEIEGFNGQTGHRINIGGATLDIVQLEPYTEDDGNQFGTMLLNMKSKDLI